MADYNMGPFKPNPKGDFKPSENYKYFDFVYYKGASYLNINKDLVDGISCTGILPEGSSNSEEYWMLVAKGLFSIINYPFVTIAMDGKWDYSKTDKIIVPTNMNNRLDIYNITEGCCGIIITDNSNLQLPLNSDKSIDFNYVKILANQYYMYTFVTMTVNDTFKFLWNRTVMNRG